MDDSVIAVRFNDYVAHHRQEHELLDKAATAAKIAEDYRVERLNELRQEIERDRKYLVRKESNDVQLKAITDQITALEVRVRQNEQAIGKRNSSSATWVVAIGIIFIVVQIAIAVLFGGSP